MAEANKPAAADKKAAAPADEAVVSDHNQELVDAARKVLKEEAEKTEGTDGPADNFSGDASESPVDHVFSNDPYKKAFPPGPDDPSKL
jgi:hypothetical protein